MDIFKMAITTAFTFVTLNYNFEIEEIILTVDSNLKEWEATFSQIISKYRHLSRYKSGFWSEAKQNYDIIKRKCREIFKALKKIRS
jgi:hypothetical protein